MWGWLKQVVQWQLLYNVNRIWKTRHGRVEDRPLVFGKYRKVFVIGINHAYAGFFAYFTFVINQLRYCELHNYYPVVYFGEYSGNGKNVYHDRTRGDNMWEYYFEPVSEYSYSDVCEMIKNPDDELNEEDLTRLGVDDLWYLHQFNPNSIYAYTYGFYKYKRRFDRRWFERQRRSAHYFIEKYIRVRKEIMREIDDLYDKHMKGYRVLGIHMRGTDKGRVDGPGRTMKIVKPNTYIKEIDRYIQSYPSCKIFVATDQVQWLTMLKQTYGNRLIALDAQRSDDKRPVFKREGDNFNKGLEVLTDCILLSRCQYLLKCTSHVGEAALWFNPNLESLDLNYI